MSTSQIVLTAINTGILLFIVIVVAIVVAVYVVPACKEGGAIWNYTDVGKQYHGFMSKMGDANKLWCSICKRIDPNHTNEMCATCKY